MAQPEKAARKGRFFVPFRRTSGGGCNLPDGKMHPPFSAKRRRNRPDLAPLRAFPNFGSPSGICLPGAAGEGSGTLRCAFCAFFL